MSLWVWGTEKKIHNSSHLSLLIYFKCLGDTSLLQVNKQTLSLCSLQNVMLRRHLWNYTSEVLPLSLLTPTNLLCQPFTFSLSLSSPSSVPHTFSLPPLSFSLSLSPSLSPSLFTHMLLPKSCHASISLLRTNLLRLMPQDLMQCDPCGACLALCAKYLAYLAPPRLISKMNGAKSPIEWSVKCSEIMARKHKWDMQKWALLFSWIKIIILTIILFIIHYFFWQPIEIKILHKDLGRFSSP